MIDGKDDDMVPEGYRKLPSHLPPCRCPKLWRDEKGVAWCCTPPPHLPAPAQPTPECPHETRDARQDHIACRSCGMVRTDNGWGIASGQWFKDLATARFYERHGRFPEPASQPPAPPVEIDTLAGARKQAMKDHASMPPAAPVDPTNHHNALKCPYCNPKGLQFAEPAAPVETEEINFDRAKTVPIAWISFASNGNVRLWTSDEGRAREEIAGGLDMRAFTLAELIALISKLPVAPHSSAETSGQEG